MHFRNMRLFPELSLPQQRRKKMKSPKENKDPIVSPADSPKQRSRKRRAGYFLVLGIVIIALLVLAEWLVNGTIMFSQAR